MNPYQVVRIVCLLAIIFVCGLVTGRMTAPRPQPVVVNAAGKPLTVETILAGFKAQFPMSAEEELKTRRFLEEVESEIAAHPPLSPERQEIFRRTVARLKEILSPDKHAALDRFSQEMEQKFETYRRRRGLPSAPAEGKK